MKQILNDINTYEVQALDSSPALRKIINSYLTKFYSNRNINDEKTYNNMKKIPDMDYFEKKIHDLFLVEYPELMNETFIVTSIKDFAILTFKDFLYIYYFNKSSSESPPLWLMS